MTRPEPQNLFLTIKVHLYHRHHHYKHSNIGINTVQNLHYITGIIYTVLCDCWSYRIPEKLKASPVLEMQCTQNIVLASCTKWQI